MEKVVMWTLIKNGEPQCRTVFLDTILTPTVKTYRNLTIARACNVKITGNNNVIVDDDNIVDLVNKYGMN